MKSLEYVAVTLPGKAEKFYVGRVSVSGSAVQIEFPVSSKHAADVLVQRLNYAREHMGDMEGTACTAPSPSPSR